MLDPGAGPYEERFSPTHHRHFIYPTCTRSASTEVEHICGEPGYNGFAALEEPIHFHGGGFIFPVATPFLCMYRSQGACARARVPCKCSIRMECPFYGAR